MAARIGKDEFEDKVLKSELPVIVDFYSDSCVACKKLSPVLGDIEDDFEDRISVYKVNTGYEPELVETYEIMANPTLILFHKGEKVGKKVGAKTYDELKEWIQQVL